VIGQQFGNYTTLALLGEGGMGAVYLAEHPAIGRRVAIKVLREEFSRDEVALARFVNEARAANAIRHPNIIEILDSGTTATGQPYLVMELLEGEPLRARLRRAERLEARPALDIAYLTASALAAAHARGIVHRDLKPDNLFLIPDPNDPQLDFVKVLDFGIAKLQRQPGQLGERDDDSLRTQTGTLVGTPSYMSPEQCLGTKALDGRTDVYSLGIILFEMMCGRTPFQSLGFGELVHLHLNVAPPRPRAVEPEVPAAIEAIILRALLKRPEDRYQTMEEMMSALEDASGGWLAEHRRSARRMLTAKLAVTPGRTTTPATPARGSRSTGVTPTSGKAARSRGWKLLGALLAVTALGVAGARLLRPRPAAVAMEAAPAVPAPVEAVPAPPVPAPGPRPGRPGAPPAPPQDAIVPLPPAPARQKPPARPAKKPRPHPGPEPEAPAKM
jgi:serine/threonine-protein kinase